MKKQPYGPDTTRSDFIAALIENASRFLFWAGVVVSVLAIAALIFTYSAFSGGNSPGSAEQAKSNIQLFQTLLIAGTLSAYVGSASLFWGEEVLGVLQLGFAAALYFAPLYVPNLLSGGNTPGDVGQAALAAVQAGGIWSGIIGVVVLVTDIAARVKQRTTIGSRLDQLKYGKGMKEEADKQNIFMGKCYQLPFCRKFVRESCPIYHSRRTCWKERVGCMCEEQVIRDAMAGKTIPKDSVAASNYIPRNHKLSDGQKAERCRQCVIYNEHQKHKYKLAMPTVMIGWVLLYLLFRGPLLTMAGNLLNTIDRILGRLTYQKGGAVEQQVQQSGIPFQEILLVCLVVVALAYTIRVVEYLIFKLKI
ncbi:MAG: hypothetical protein KF784_13775 [Fimbriimonadaceae bacterium]|nr:hypothetical protein [Fimbriimonadaceae bacterium]